jgi:uncharacterized membrane protein
MKMFDYIEPPEKEPTDYTGLKIGVILVPVFFLFVYLGKPDIGLTVFIVLGMIIFAIKLRWKLRKHVWFWATISLILLLHIPLLFVVRWPQSNIPTIVYAMPMGITDFLLIMGGIGLAEKIFSKGSSSNDEEA